LAVMNMMIMPKGMTGWLTALMHALEAFVGGVVLAFICCIPFQHAPLGERLIVVHCGVTTVLFIVSLGILFRGRTVASTGVLIGLAGIVAALYLLPNLGK